MIGIGELSWWVIAPNRQILDVRNRDPLSFHSVPFFNYLRCSSILIKSCQGRKIFLWNRWSCLLAEKSICVARITYHYNFDILTCYFINNFALLDKDAGVLLKQVWSLHSRQPGFRPNQNRKVCFIEGLFIFETRLDTLHKLISSILQLQYKTLESLLSKGKLQ